jgi:hypothetical protein
MELVDMNSLGLFDFKSYPFKSDLPYLCLLFNNIIHDHCIFNFSILICCRLTGKS